MLLPGRVPGYCRTDIKLLPSSVTKRNIWKDNRDAMIKCDQRAASYRTFCRRWLELLPSLVIMKPLTDLCWTCQQRGEAIKSASSSLEEKNAALQAYQDHLTTVTIERSYYTAVRKECKDSITQHYTVNNEFSPPPLHSRAEPNSAPIKAHYSFDYAQQVRAMYCTCVLQSRTVRACKINF